MPSHNCTHTLLPYQASRDTRGTIPYRGGDPSAGVGECPFTVADAHTQVGYTRGSGGKLAASRSEVPQLAIIFRCYRLGEQFIGLEKTSKACTTRLHRSVVPVQPRSRNPGHNHPIRSAGDGIEPVWPIVFHVLNLENYCYIVPLVLILVGQCTF